MQNTRLISESRILHLHKIMYSAVTKNKGVFPSDTALEKLVYLRA